MIKKLLILLVAVTGTSFTMNAQNLLLNGGFETYPGTTYPNGDNSKPLNTFTNWNAVNGYSQISQELTNVHTGSSALKAIPTGIVGQQWALQLESDAVTTVIGKSYELSMWVKGANAGNTVRFSNNIPTYGSDVAVVGGTWQKVIYTFTATATTTKIRLELGGSNTTANTFYVDDVAMIEVANLYLTFNEGFESLDPANAVNKPYYWWNFYGTTNSNATLTDETTIVHGGGHAAKVVIGTAANAWEPQLAQGKALTTTIGHTYTVTFWIKGVVGGGKVQSSNTGSSLYGPQLTVTTAWQQYSHTFTATTASYQLYLHLGGFIDTYYVDDTSVVDTTPLGIEDFNAKNDKIVFYPNPVKENLNISSDSEIKSITITDLTGKTVRTIKNAENIQSIDLSGLNQGMYILSTDTNKQFKFLKN